MDVIVFAYFFPSFMGISKWILLSFFPFKCPNLILRAFVEKLEGNNIHTHIYRGEGGGFSGWVRAALKSRILLVAATPHHWEPSRGETRAISSYRILHSMPLVSALPRGKFGEIIIRLYCCVWLPLDSTGGPGKCKWRCWTKSTTDTTPVYKQQEWD